MTLVQQIARRLVLQRGWALTAAICGAVLALENVATAAQPTVEYALGLVPSQKNIECSRLTPEQAKGATIKMEKEGGATAWVVRDSRGEVLRAFADTNADRVVDRWSYYKDGVEVYRDIDSNHNSKADQARWFHSAGSRWGVDDDGNGSVDSWKVISAEETTAEIVEPLRLHSFFNHSPTTLTYANPQGVRLFRMLGEDSRTTAHSSISTAIFLRCRSPTMSQVLNPAVNSRLFLHIA